MADIGEEGFEKREEKIDSPDIRERRKERAKEKMREWLKDRNNLIFIGILVLAIAIRLYFFSLTKTQALWWDEADYMAYAKNIAGIGGSWIIATKHNSFYPYLAAAIFKIGFGELMAKLLLQVIPSILSVVIVYLLANEMYKDKRIGLIAAFLMSVFWVSLFNTTRFHVDIPGVFFGLLCIYVFWKGYEKKEKIFGLGHQWAIPIAAALAVLTYSIRRGYFLFGVFIVLYVLLTKNWKEIIKDKYNWIGLVLGLILVFIVEKSIFISAIGDVGGEYFHEELPINFLPLQVFSSFFKFGSQWNVALFYLFWAGLILVIGKIALSFGYIRKENGEVRADLFNILTIITTLAFFIYVLRSQTDFGEPRWYFPLAFAAFICISKSGLFISDFVNKYNKQIAVVILIILIGVGGYYQYKFSDELIKSKTESYSGIREAGLYLKGIVGENDIIWTLGQPQVEYYSERSTVNARVWAEGYSLENNTQHFEATMQKIKEHPEVRFIVITFSEPAYPAWAQRTINTQDGRVAVWEIPFMQTKIDFSTGQEQINEEGRYENLTFKLIDVKQEVFIYEIIRNDLTNNIIVNNSSILNS